MQPRYKSWAAWSTTFVLVVFVLKTYLNIDIPKIDELITLIMTAGIAWGIWNDPTNGRGY